MAAIVIADASPLIALARVGGLGWLQHLITSARQVFAALHASDFRIAPAVIKAVLNRCGD
jgi:predicted nucleic acid-binding protein